MLTAAGSKASKNLLLRQLTPAPWLLLVLLALLVTGLLSATAWLTKLNAYADLRRQSQESLEVYATALANEIDKNRTLPLVLAQFPIFAETLRNPEDISLVDAANRQLDTFNLLSRNLTTYLLDSNGVVVASSNWADPGSFIGEDLSFRPYYSVAINEGSAAYFALGTTSGTRGYYFSSAVMSDGLTVGVIVLKIDLSRLEKSWEQGGDIVLVTDQDGVIFISSLPDWLYHSLNPLTAEDLARVHESRRYPNREIQPLHVASREKFSRTVERVWLRGAKPDQEQSYLQLSRTMPEKAWTLHILADDTSVFSAIRNAVVLVGLLSLLTLTGLLLIRNRLQAKQHRAQMKLEAYAQLESLVDQRTEELRGEINERKQIESDLRETRSNLVQASKMAALGQMATGINHELNQPLSAIRSFAENASTLLHREDFREVDSNLQLIVRLTERMDGIMKHLKLFARKAQPELASVSVQATIHETLEVLAPAIRKNDVTVHSDLPDRDYRVIAESNRLQQVFTNLIQNAIDVLDDCTKREITLTVKESNIGGRLDIYVSDTGGGINPTIQSRLFEPFFTTKSADSGLGLGLSITAGIIKDFGGDIALVATGESGSTFKVSLCLVNHAEASAA